MTHERFMARALAAARRYHPSPNPRVGAVVVKGGRVLAVEAHRAAGEEHAEVAALRKAGPAARGAALYVTLEPCNHVGRTPKCTDAVIASGVRRVFVGVRDPNPQVAGGGVERLRRAGIEVSLGLLEDDCRALIEDFAKTVTRGLPLVTLKLAQTLDGRLATRTGDTKWVTGEAARREAHRLRASHDAVLVGIGTVLADDPALTTRLVRGRDPRRVVVDSRLRTPPDAAVLAGRGAIVLAARPTPSRTRSLERKGAEVVACPARDGRVDLRAGLRRLAARGVLSLLVEGGGEIAASMLEARLVDRLVLFVSPRIVGGRDAVPAVGGRGAARLADAWRVGEVEVRRCGDDLVLRGHLEPPA